MELKDGSLSLKFQPRNYRRHDPYKNFMSPLPSKSTLFVCLRLLSIFAHSRPRFLLSPSQTQSLIPLPCSVLSDSSWVEFDGELRIMNGYYSKMRAIRSSTHKSRSVDYSDLLHFPSSETELPKTEHDAADETRETIRTKNNQRKDAELRDGCVHDLSTAGEKQEAGGESFGVVLSRSCSVASKRFAGGLEKQRIGAQCSAVKRAFSMRRSSSMSERYSRIHDRSLMQEDDEEEDEGVDMIGSMKKHKNKNRGGKIFKACKRLFGL